MKAILIYRCTNPECKALGRADGKKSLPILTDKEATVAFAANNGCPFCESPLKTENMSVEDS